MSDRPSAAPLLIPAIRWSDDDGFEHERDKIDTALKLGVGGFIFFGGKSGAVRELVSELQSRSEFPLLIGADLERGAGQQFEGLTQLPPLAALGFLNDVNVVRRAAQVTALEARSLGVNWIYSPSCDLDIEPNNPIIGTRSFSGDPDRVADLASEWIDACQHAGAMACAKHFPGHGRTVRDSHAELPSVDVSKEVLLQTDLKPFRSAIDAGVATVMTAHVAFPALDSTGSPATLSRSILHDLLRGELGFDGIVVTDAFIMQGVLGGGEKGAAVRAIESGCDILLYPEDIEGVARALQQVDPDRVNDALQRRRRWADWCGASVDVDADTSANKQWADQVATRTVHVLRGGKPPVINGVDVVTVDDDLGGPYPPPSREHFVEELRANGMDVKELHTPSLDSGRLAVIALYGDVRAWKGRSGYSDASVQAVRGACDAAYRAGQNTVIVQFSHPRMETQLPPDVPLLCAWGGEAIMQRAAARKLLQNESLEAH